MFVEIHQVEYIPLMKSYFVWENYFVCFVCIDINCQSKRFMYKEKNWNFHKLCSVGVESSESMEISK